MSHTIKTKFVLPLADQVAHAQATCTVNGQAVPCEQAYQAVKGFAGWGIGLFALVFLLGIASTVFWLVMLIHAATKPIENKALWILVMVFTGIIGALVYYFMVKRSYNKQMSGMPMSPPSMPQAPMPPMAS